MSIHIQSPVWLAEFPRGAMKTVALKLADCADDDGEGVYPSVSRVSRETGHSESTVRETIAAFEECGLLIEIDAGTGNRFGRSTTNRKFDLQKLMSLAAVDLRDGSGCFIPPTHCMKQFDLGRTRENKKGEIVPVLEWRIVPRGDDDPSSYDDLAPPGHPRRPSGERTPPLRRAEGAPPVSGPKPSKNHQ